MPKSPNADIASHVTENFLMIDDPYRFSGIFAFLFSAGNIHDVAYLYTNDASLIGLDGKQHCGRAAIAEYLGHFLLQGLALRHVIRSAIVHSENALLINDFQLLSQKFVVCSGICVTVLRRDSDKGWRSMIENNAYTDWHAVGRTNA
jgi:ketosteroid isomerase-like protein